LRSLGSTSWTTLVEELMPGYDWRTMMYLAGVTTEAPTSVCVFRARRFAQVYFLDHTSIADALRAAPHPRHMAA
jgi:hypothetical protein